MKAVTIGVLLMFVSISLSFAQTATSVQLPTTSPKASAAAAASMNFVTPTTGMSTIPYWKRGTTQTITWTGGPSTVMLSLVDFCSWTVYTTLVPTMPNSHSYSWNIPNTLPCGIYCCYIQNVGSPTTWTYSNNFAISR